MKKFHYKIFVVVLGLVIVVSAAPFRPIPLAQAVCGPGTDAVRINSFGIAPTSTSGNLVHFNVDLFRSCNLGFMPDMSWIVGVLGTSVNSGVTDYPNCNQFQNQQCKQRFTDANDLNIASLSTGDYIVELDQCMGLGYDCPLDKNVSDDYRDIRLHVDHGGNGGGVISVISKSTTGVEVRSSWEFATQQGDDPCQIQGNHCNGTAEEYQNVDYNNVNYTIYTTGNPNGYALHSIERTPVAEVPGTAMGKIFAWVKNLVAMVANAIAVPEGWSQTLTSGNKTATFTLTWDPLGDLAYSPPQGLHLTPDSPQGTVQISNDGTAGSKIIWSATPDENWIASVTPAQNPQGNQGVLQGHSDSVVIALDLVKAMQLGQGTHQGSVTVTGKSWCTLPGDNNPGYVCPQFSSLQIQIPVSVTISGPPPDCPTFQAVPSTITPPQSSNLNYLCHQVTSCTITAPGVDHSIPINNQHDTTGSPYVVTPTSTTEYTLTCTGRNGWDNPLILGTQVVTVSAPNRHETNP